MKVKSISIDAHKAEGDRRKWYWSIGLNVFNTRAFYLDSEHIQRYCTKKDAIKGAHDFIRKNIKKPINEIYVCK